MRTITHNNNNRSRSNSPGSSRSANPPARRVINHALAQFNREKRPISDYTMPLKEVMEWPEFDRQLAAPLISMAWIRCLMNIILPHQDQMMRMYSRRCRVTCTRCLSNSSRRQKACVLSRNIKVIRMHRPYTKSYVITTLGRHRRWQSATSMRWKVASWMERSPRIGVSLYC